ncbi:unnamed protein product [Ixodes pacificus]
MIPCQLGNVMGGIAQHFFKSSFSSCFASECKLGYALAFVLSSFALARDVLLDVRSDMFVKWLYSIRYKHAKVNVSPEFNLAYLEKRKLGSFSFYTVVPFSCCEFWY